MKTVELRTPSGEVYAPLPMQAAFHASSATARAAVGGFGCGKSLCGAVEGLLQSLEPVDGRGGVGLIARFDWDELMSTTWKMFLDIIPPDIKSLCQIRERPTPMVKFPNGFTVIGFNLKRHEKMGSLELSWAWIDECNEAGVDESFYLQLFGRRRNKVGRRQIWLTGNPAGRNWVWKRFFAYREDPGMRRYRGHEGFLAGTSENVYLPEDYKRAMAEVYPEEWLEKFYSGSFDVYEGQILDNFDPRLHVLRPFDIPARWPRYRALDHGLTHPSVCTWGTMDPQGNLIIYRELYRRNTTPEEMVADILTASKGEEEVTEWTVIDPATRGKQTAGGVIEPIIQQYRMAGLPCYEANNDVKASITRLKSLLRPDPERAFPYWHPSAGLPGCPRLFITTDCPMLKWEIEQWKWKDVKPGGGGRERPVAVNDDGLACVRYMVMRQPQPAAAIPLSNPHQRFLDILAELKAEPRPDSRLYIGSERL